VALLHCRPDLSRVAGNRLDVGSELEHHRGAEAFVVALINHAQHQFLNEGVRREFRADATDDTGPEVLHPGAARLWKTGQKDIVRIKLGDQKVAGERANFLCELRTGLCNRV
jgi:hypothetical protein